MVALAKRLLEKGYAYEKLRSVYFDISRFKGYGAVPGGPGQDPGGKDRGPG